MERFFACAVLLGVASAGCFYERACDPTSCLAAGKSCGEMSDGCERVLDCGTCDEPAACGVVEPNVCSITMDLDNCLDGWCPVNPPVPPFDAEWGGVSALAADDAWAAGNRGALLRYDGAWHMVTASEHDFVDVWMAAPDDGWLIADGGTIYRWDGEAWSEVVRPTTGALRGVHGSSPDDVWLVGDVTLHWDGTVLAAVATEPPLVHVYDGGDGAVWATGLSFSDGQDRIWHWDGSEWRDQTGGVHESERRFNGIIGVGGEPVFAVGRIYDFLEPSQSFSATWNGSSWAFRSPSAVGEPDPSLLDVFLDGERPVAVGSDGAFRLDDSTLLPAPVPLRVGDAAGGRWFAFGDLGEPLSSDGLTWQLDREGAYETMGAIGDAGDDVWIAGDGVLLQSSGGAIVEHRPSPFRFTSVAGTSATDVWATSADSTQVWRWDGLVWSSVATPDGMQVSAVIARGDGLVLLVGAGVYRWDGAGWVEDLPPEVGLLWTLAAAGDGDDVWVAGGTLSAPRVAQRRAGVWAEVAPPPILPCAIDATGDDELWLSGDFVTKWNGAAWARVPMPSTLAQAPLCALAVRDDDIWLLDWLGAVVHREPDGAWASASVVRAGNLFAVHATAGAIWAAGDEGLVVRHD